MLTDTTAKEWVSLGIVIMIGYGIYNAGKVPEHRPWTNETTEGEASRPLGATDQANLEEISNVFAKAFNDANNEVIQGRLRQERGKTICTLFRSRFVQGWTGKIKDVSSSMDGSSVSRVKIDFEGAFALLDSSTHKAGSTVHSAFLSGLSEGDRVRVSGEFKYDSGDSANDCFYETNLTVKYGMKYPEYKFSITNLSDIKGE
jgi:hypothetical protein